SLHDEVRAWRAKLKSYRGGGLAALPLHRLVIFSKNADLPCATGPRPSRLSPPPWSGGGGIRGGSGECAGTCSQASRQSAREAHVAAREAMCCMLRPVPERA